MWYFGIIFLIFVVLLFLLPLAIHFGFRVPENPEKTDPGSLGLEFETVSVPTVSGKHLFGWLLPVPGAESTIIILHGWGGNSEQMLPMALPFYRAGMNVLLIDARNHGYSDRDSFSSLPRFAEDAEKAIEWLKRNHPDSSRKIALLGHSVGGGAVLYAASRRSDVDAVISISAFAHPRWMMQRFLKQSRIPNFLSSIVIRYVEWVIGHRYDEIAPVNTICHIRCPVLLLHGESDRTVPIEDALAIEEGCRRPHITLLTVEGAGHESVEKIKLHEKELIAFLQDCDFPIRLSYVSGKLHKNQQRER